MDGRRLLGSVLVVAASALVTIGLVGLVRGIGQAPTGAVSSAGPSASIGAPSTQAVETPARATPGPTSTPAPTVSPTPDVESLVRAFFVQLQAAIRAGTQGGLADSLAAAVVERYGLEVCRSALAAKEAVPGQQFEIMGVRPPAPWDYVTDGLTTTIPSTTTVDARVTAPDAGGVLRTEDRELHVQVRDGRVSWFTDCGDPISPP